MEMAGTLKDVLPIDILSQSDQEELVGEMRVRRFRAGEVVYHSGDAATNAYVVFSGLVKVMLLDALGREALVALHGRGEFFGELALFREAPRANTVSAIIPTTVLQMSRDSCWRVLDRNAEAREYMFRHLSSTIARLEDKYEAMVFLDVAGRLAKYLLELDHVGGDLPITQDDLAAAIGSTRVTVNKALADLERRQIVRVDRRSVDILDAPALARELSR